MFKMPCGNAGIMEKSKKRLSHNPLDNTPLRYVLPTLQQGLRLLIKLKKRGKQKGGRRFAPLREKTKQK